MSLESDLYTYLVAQPAVFALIGTRLYPNALQATATGFTYPSATYQRASVVPTHNTAGRQPLTMARLQIDVYAVGSTGYSTARTVAKAIRDEMEGVSGLIGSTTIRSIRLEDEDDSPHKDLGVNDSRPYRIRMDFIVWYLEDLP